MNCVLCSNKNCRSLKECKAFKADAEEVLAIYHKAENQEIVQAAATLVDNGRAGTLSRLNEILEFIRIKRYKKVGVAYCYGMEKDAGLFISVLSASIGIKVFGISCTAGSMGQEEVNETSCIHNVSCNPVAQALQLKFEGAEFVITMGLCLGHDILFNKYIDTDTTTFIVKDRVNNHNPILELKKQLKNK